MAKDIDLNQPVTLTAGDILQIFAKFQQDQALASEAQAKVLAEAFAESRKPYVDPGQEINRQNQRDAQRKIEIFKFKNLRRQQRVCEHEVGQTGRKRLGEGAFCGLRLATGETIGVCQYCQKVISSANPEHSQFFRKINGEVAQANQLTGSTDPIKVQLARLGEDERKHVEEVRAKFIATVTSPELEDDEPLF